MVSLEIGVSLEDSFNFSCSGWNDSEGGVEYNFAKQDTNTFSNTYAFYSETRQWSNVYLSSGTHDIYGIIIDEYNLAACESISVYVTRNISELSESADNFTTWVTDSYTDILDDIFDTSTSMNETITNGTDTINTNNISDSNVLSSAMQVLDTVYDLTLDYIEINKFDGEDLLSTNDNETHVLIELQEEILNVLVNITIDQSVDSEAEVSSVLTTLVEITEPLVTIDDTDDTNRNGTVVVSTAVYDSETISNVLEVVTDNIISTLSEVTNNNDNISNSTATALSSDTAQQEMRTISDEDSDAIDNGQSMVDDTTTVAELVLIQTIPDETYYFETDKMNVPASKISHVYIQIIIYVIQQVVVMLIYSYHKN